MALKNTNNWTAGGSLESKKEFLSLLIRNGVKTFGGKKTAKHILLFGSYIKGIDYNRKGDRGSFFISTDSIEVSESIHFNLDKVDLEWVMQFILQK